MNTPKGKQSVPSSDKNEPSKLKSRLINILCRTLGFVGIPFVLAGGYTVYNYVREQVGLIIGDPDITKEVLLEKFLNEEFVSRYSTRLKQTGGEPLLNIPIIKHPYKITAEDISGNISSSLSKTTKEKLAKIKKSEELAKQEVLPKKEELPIKSYVENNQKRIQSCTDGRIFTVYPSKCYVSLNTPTINNTKLIKGDLLISSNKRPGENEKVVLHVITTDPSGNINNDYVRTAGHKKSKNIKNIPPKNLSGHEGYCDLTWENKIHQEDDSNLIPFQFMAGEGEYFSVNNSKLFTGPCLIQGYVSDRNIYPVSDIGAIAQQSVFSEEQEIKAGLNSNGVNGMNNSNDSSGSQTTRGQTVKAEDIPPREYMKLPEENHSNDANQNNNGQKPQKDLNQPSKKAELKELPKENHPNNTNQDNNGQEPKKNFNKPPKKTELKIPMEPVDNKNAFNL